MKVKVVKCKIKTRWYSTHIGEVFEVSKRIDADVWYKVLPLKTSGRRVIYSGDCRPLKAKVAPKTAPNKQKLFTNVHAAYSKWESRHPEITSSEACFEAGAKWAARQLL